MLFCVFYNIFFKNYNSTCVAGFLNKLRSKGSCTIKYPVPREIGEKLNIKEKKIRFATHVQLDEFVKKVVEHFPLFKEEYKDDYYLLKSFDRAFWLRHFKSDLHVDCKPALEGCPFDNPQSSSFLKDWFS